MVIIFNTLSIAEMLHYCAIYKSNNDTDTDITPYVPIYTQLYYL